MHTEVEWIIRCFTFLQLLIQIEPKIIRKVYGTYGELLKGDTNLTSYLYNGKYGVMTDENGLYYMRHRYYNTDIRRFVNQDIVKGNLGNSQSLNRYSYVQGNPLTYTDPFGLSPEKDGGSIGMNIVHGLLDALGCVPGGVGIVANFANAALYAVVDHDYGMAALSLVAGVTLGASKIVSMGGKLAGHAKSIETIGRLVSNTASFAICAEQTVSSSAAMWNKYHENGAKLSGETALEILGIGLNVAGMAASGKGIVESGNRLGKMVKEGGTTNKMSKGISEKGSSSKIANKFPNEAMPSDGKVFDYYIENGRIKGIDGRNNADFVITTDNNLIIGNKHHYLGNGQDVLAAGQLKINGQGQIKRIDNLSGHYRPTVDEAMRYQSLFENLGLDLNKTWLEYYRIDIDSDGMVVNTSLDYIKMLGGK